MWTSSQVLLVAVSCLTLGAVLGVMFISMCIVGRRADEQEFDFEAKRFTHDGVAVAWRGRPQPVDGKHKWAWRLSSEGPDTFPEHWQIQGLGVICEVKDL